MGSLRVVMDAPRPALPGTAKAEPDGKGAIVHSTERSEEQPMTDNAIDRSADILGGTPVFSGTRVPVRILIEYLEAGDRLDDFLDNFPTVSRSQAIDVLERAKALLAGHSSEAAA